MHTSEESSNAAKRVSNILAYTVFSMIKYDSFYVSWFSPVSFSKSIISLTIRVPAFLSCWEFLSTFC